MSIDFLTVNIGYVTMGVGFVAMSISYITGKKPVGVAYVTMRLVLPPRVPILSL
ncbi:hypothetical protein LOAG_18946 [Loa loa]|uniref:Uncharacterized protein n=1 Tax=Loa loa TaxID=7209 RepID=A0A1S0UDA0_LOALO|nr:hypothetical protein LOAG_18946 [Loa loa]EJD73640.1 hypothetical protein LOAG_18946 [Loa loa]